MKCCWIGNFHYYHCRKFFSVIDFDTDNLLFKLEDFEEKTGGLLINIEMFYILNNKKIVKKIFFAIPC